MRPHLGAFLRRWKRPEWTLYFGVGRTGSDHGRSPWRSDGGGGRLKTWSDHPNGTKWSRSGRPQHQCWDPHPDKRDKLAQGLLWTSKLPIVPGEQKGDNKGCIILRLVSDLTTCTKEVMILPRLLCWSVGLSADLHKNYLTDYHETWM